MCMKRLSMVQKSASKALGGTQKAIKRRPYKCVTLLFSPSAIADEPQTLHQVVAIWKRLEHQNIVPFLGITPIPLRLISEWMPGGELTEHIREHPGVDRLGLVGEPLVVFDPTLTSITSYPASLKASTSSTPGT